MGQQQEQGCGYEAAGGLPPQPLAQAVMLAQLAGIAHERSTHRKLATASLSNDPSWPSGQQSAAAFSPSEAPPVAHLAQPYGTQPWYQVALV